MSDQNKKTYELEEPREPMPADLGKAAESGELREPRESAPPAAVPMSASAAAAREISSPSTPEPDAIAALDVCPACGAALGDIDKLVCIRCGFDLKTNKPLETKVAADEAPGIVDGQGDVVSPSGRGGTWLPMAIAAVAAAALTIGCLWGAPGLVHGEDISLLTRLITWIRVLSSTILLAGCGLAALLVFARISSRPLGPWRLAAWRMIAIVAAAALILFLNITFWPGELTVESVLRAAAFVGLAMLAFNLDLREAATLLGIHIACVLGLLAVAALVLWVMTP